MPTNPYDGCLTLRVAYRGRADQEEFEEMKLNNYNKVKEQARCDLTLQELIVLQIAVGLHLREFSTLPGLTDRQRAAQAETKTLYDDLTTILEKVGEQV